MKYRLFSLLFLFTGALTVYAQTDKGKDIPCYYLTIDDVADSRKLLPRHLQKAVSISHTTRNNISVAKNFVPLNAEPRQYVTQWSVATMLYVISLKLSVWKSH